MKFIYFIAFKKIISFFFGSFQNIVNCTDTFQTEESNSAPLINNLYEPGTSFIDPSIEINLTFQHQTTLQNTYNSSDTNDLYTPVYLPSITENVGIIY